MRNKLTAGILLALASNYAAADELPNVLVEEQGSLKTYDVYSEPKSFKTSTQEFTQKDFKALPVNNVYEMLDYGTGAFIQKHGRKSPILASIRAGSNLGIILDGAYLPAPAASKVLMQLPISAVKSMKIVRDTSALNLGPLSSIDGAMTGSRTEGFIVIQTLGAHDKLDTTSINTKLGNYGEVGADIGHATKLTEEIAARAILGFEHKDGKSGYYNGYQRKSGLWKLEGLHDKFDWQLNFYHADGEMDLQRGLEHSGVRPAKWSYDPMTLRMINSQAGYHWDDNNSTAIRLGYTDSRATLHQKNHMNPAVHTEEKTTEKFYNLDISHAITFKNNLLRFGYNHMQYHNPTGMLFYPGFEKQETYNSVYLQDELIWKKFTFDLGARLDKRTINKGYEQVGSSDVGAGAAGKRYPISDLKLDDLLTLAAGSSYQIAANSMASLRVLYTEQQPVSVYSANGESLPKENRFRTELGWSHGWNSWFNSSITAFNEKLTDAAYVAKDIDDPDVAGFKLSVYDTESWKNNGIELEIKGGNRRFGYELALSKVKVGASNMTNLPTKLARARLMYQGDIWYGNLGARAMNEYRSYSHASNGMAGDFITVDAKVGRNFKWLEHQHQISLYGKNLTNKKYETMYGFPDEGINFGVNYSVEF